MAQTYEPLDFELEDPIPICTPVTRKKKKLIGLDDLLVDYQNEQKSLYEKKCKRAKVQKVSEADDEFDDATEARLSECVDKCQKEMDQTICDDEIPFWGIQIFQEQESFPQQEYLELKSSVLIQSLSNHEIYSFLEMKTDEGENFLEGLLINGWLLNLVYTCGCVERAIARWIFDIMMYSSKQRLVESACEFWCTILTKHKADLSGIKLEWLPRCSDLKGALENYGFSLYSPSKSLPDVETSSVSGAVGPPPNIRSWIKCVEVCCLARDTLPIFTTMEAEELQAIIISLFLDRQLLGLSVTLNECMLSVTNFFRDEEWHDSCEKIAKFVACRLPVDINCLKVVESISGVDARSKRLRSVVAFQFLVQFLNEKVHHAEEILRMLISINVKDKKCDLFKMYVCLNLAENWLFLNPVQHEEMIHELWVVFLRNCSSGITITDLRSYASNVRSKASYLLQGTAK